MLPRSAKIIEVKIHDALLRLYLGPFQSFLDSQLEYYPQEIFLKPKKQTMSDWT